MSNIEYTPEEKAAVAEMEAAIKKVAAVMGYLDENWVMTRFMVLFTAVRFDEEGRQMERNATLLPGDALSLTDILGMIHYARLRWEREVTQDDDLS